jgi:hypothetical protein
MKTKAHIYGNPVYILSIDHVYDSYTRKPLTLVSYINRDGGRVLIADTEFTDIIIKKEDLNDFKEHLSLVIGDE